MKVYDALARAFAAEGASAVFGIMGDANMYWMNSLHKEGVKLYDVRHEGAGLALADGWARIAGKPGVCTTTSGPGCTQLATTMVVASRARTPLVAFCGEASVGDYEWSQWFNQERFAEAIECGFVKVNSPDDADEAVRKAFYRARVESRPIMLSAPMNVQAKAYDNPDEYVPSTALYKSEPIYPNPERIKEAAEIVAGSTNPVIVVGRGAMWAGAGDAVLNLGERIGALIATTLMAKNWLSESEWHAGISGLYSTRTSIELFQETDCVIAVGASLNQYTIEHGYLYPNARFIHIDPRQHIVMGGGRSADCYVHSDGKLGVELLEQALAEQSFHNTGYRTPEVSKRLKHKYADPAEFEVEPGTVDARAICMTMDEDIPTNVGMILGGGQNVCFSTMLFNRKRDLTLLNQHFGCIGQGLTTAMGAVIASGNKPAFLVEGDVGLMMHLAEFETAVRYNLPLMVVVLNDQALGAEYHKSKAHHMNVDLATVTTPDLGEVARALGGRGSLVRSVEEMRAATAEFLANPGPMMVDVRISRNVLSIPYRRLHFGEDA